MEEAVDIKDEVVTTEENKTQKKREESNKYYKVVYREGSKIHTCISKIQNLTPGEIVMVQTDHGPEPAKMRGGSFLMPIDVSGKKVDLANIIRRATRDEIEKYQNLLEREREAIKFCNERIEQLSLAMKLIYVERFFNGSKIIFYFTAENRVDFRVLVKELVQEFRTRVEMRQIGVRHETQMLGGLGCCGRELCCSLFMNKFVPVSIKMAKEQDLPLNPAKISGACNRLLCCLTHEFETYKALKKNMPKLGKTVNYNDTAYVVTQCNTLKESVTLRSIQDSDNVIELASTEWNKVSPASKHIKKTDEQSNDQVEKNNDRDQKATDNDVSDKKKNKQAQPKPARKPMLSVKNKTDRRPKSAANKKPLASQKQKGNQGNRKAKKK